MKKIFLLALMCVLIGCGSKTADVIEVAPTPEKKVENKVKKEVDKPLPAKEKEKKPGFVQLEMESGRVQWTGKKLRKTHVGTIDIKSASLDVAAELIEAEFILNMKSITSDSKGLDTHLKGKDFFDVKKHPTAKLFINKAVPRAPGQYQMTGYLTIKGIQKGISFPAQAEETPDGKIVTRAKFTIDRTLWGITYGSGKFFDNLGDQLISDKVDFDVEVVFVEPS